MKLCTPRAAVSETVCLLVRHLPNRFVVLPLLVALISASVVGDASGQATNGNGVWNRTAGGTFNWAPPSTGPDRNWWALGNSNYPSGLDATATLTTNITGNQTVELETAANAALNVQLRTLAFGDSTLSSGVYHNFTISAPTGGVLTIGSINAVGAINSQNGNNVISAAITLGNATTISHTTASGSLLISGGITNAGNLLTFDGTGTTTLSTAAVSGAGGLTKNGAGTLNLNFANTYTGTTTVNAGSLVYNVSNAISSGGVTVNGGILNIGAFNDTVGTVIIAGGTISGTSGELTSNANFDGRSGLVSAILRGAVGLDKTTAGTLTLSGANVYTGTTTVSAGTLAYGASNVIASGGITVNGGTLDIGVYSDTVGTVIINGGSISGTSGVLTSNANFDGRSGSVTAILGGSVGLDKTTGGSLILNSASVYTGDTTITGGTLSVGSSGSFNNSPNIVVGSGGILDVTSQATFNIASGQTLSGTGSVLANELAFGTGAVLSPGASTGTISVTGDMTFGADGAYTFELNDAAGVAGSDPGWDLALVSGVLDIAATSGNPFTISLQTLTLANSPGLADNFNPLSDYTWTIVTAGGGITNFAANKFFVDTTGFANPISGSFSVVTSGNNLQLSYAAVPEPEAIVCMLLAGIGGLYFWRRRQNHLAKQLQSAS
jgi:autotransporter-associated beta strand protein